MAKSTTQSGNVSTDDSILERARHFYERARDYWNENHETGRDDLRFGRLGEQWHPSDLKQRELDRRPCEVFNKLPTFIKQVVNDARQNKPSIKVHPADDRADPETAEIYNGLIRNIEVVSNADAAYDTGIESAVDKGFGYVRVNVKYACDDTFDRDIIIERVANSFTVFPDYRSSAVDSSDWNEALIVTMLPKDEYQAEYPKAEKVNWDFDFQGMPDWFDGESVTVAEYWHREKTMKTLVSAGGVAMWQGDFDRRVGEGEMLILDENVQPEERPQHKVTQYILSGAELLKTIPWAGRYIPIIPVYGDEIIKEDGKRLFRSLIYGAKGAQRIYMYMRNTGIELVGLASKSPWIGKKGTFQSDPNWQTANTTTHAYLEFDGEAPQRAPYPGVPQGVIQEALSANDDMKAIIGLHDASLGIQSNETSGKAIMARQREGDVATFHFIDNQNRMIRHVGLILIDLIPKVYTPGRIARVLGEDMKPRTVPLGQPVMEEDKQGNPVQRIYDLTAGKYDLTVASGPSYTSRREEVSEQLVAMAQAGGETVAAILAPRIAKLQDIPDADEIAEELESLNPAKKQEQGIPPELQQQMQEGMQHIQQLEAENASLKADQQGKQAEMQMRQMDVAAKAQESATNAQLKQVELQIKAKELAIKEQELLIKQYEAETDRMQAMKPDPQPTAFQGSA